MNIKNFKNKGFTLIEMMVVVTIIGILAAIAIPSYQSYIVDSRRTAATAAIGELQIQLEQWRAERPSYAGSGDEYPSVPTDNPYYEFSIPQTDATATSYSIIAEPTEKQEDTECGTLTLSYENGVVSKSASGDATDCWK